MMTSSNFLSLSGLIEYVLEPIKRGPDRSEGKSQFSQCVLVTKARDLGDDLQNSCAT